MPLEPERITRKRRIDPRLSRAGWSVVPFRPEFPVGSYKRADFADLTGIPQNLRLRPYQVEANTAVEQAIRERKRKMLLAMATGTGKTLTMVNEVYRLMRSGVARRVLFLVDRRALAAQAVRAFASFEAESGLKFDKIYPVYSQRFQKGDMEEGEKWDPNVMPNSLLTDPKLGDAFVYVCTIQRMAINLLGGEGALTIDDEQVDVDAEQLNIPIHAFDLIIADECHRGYSAKDLSVWRTTLDHFDAIKVGLTATPAAHTMAYFENMVFRYEYDRAVREGYLVDYDVVRVRSNVRMNGVFLNQGEQIDQVDPETGTRQLDLLEDERTFDASEVERKITAPDSNRKILDELKAYADEHEREYGRFPKTLIFAANDLPHTSHADQLVDLARDIFGRGDAFVAKITGRVDRPLQRIREFRNRPNPGIVVTVDLLTTGVDIPDLEYIVFLRPVKSRILFEQMLGGGTRKGERHPDKSHFTVFDCFDGSLLEYFRSTTGMTVEPPEGDGKSIAQIIEEIWQNRDRAYNTRRLVKRLQRIDKQMSGDARELFARFIPDGDVGRFAEDLASLLRESFTDTMRTLRDADFQKLLDNAYPFLRVVNVLRDRLDLGEIHQMELFPGELEAYRLNIDDLLIIEGNGSVSEIGRSAIWHGEIENCVHQNHIIRVRPFEADSEYINAFWNSLHGAREVADLAVTSAGLYNLNVGKVSAFLVPLPPIEEQLEIVARVRTLLKGADGLLDRINEANRVVDRSSQAILNKAFRGELRTDAVTEART